ncbi:MAG: hypothetical protein M1822_005014 [Bathelium mastoideum]|nr:MAG: hypothetical protein M1822_005014 [Bathelium mastoideum]
MANQTVVVIGSCGFVGYHVLKMIKEVHPSWSLHGMSRKPNRNLLEGVKYHTGNISSYEDIEAVFLQVRPTIVVHTASPAVVGDRADIHSCYSTNVDGTRYLLDCAVAAQSAKAFVYTSSATVVEGTEQHMASEDALVKTEESKCDDYAKSKALAERMVLQTNGSANMLTVCLRLPSTYGECDEQNIGEGIKAMRRNEHKLQIGDNTSLCDWLSAENAARAHLLAVESLLVEHQQPKGNAERVAGETFFVTDGEPLPFWDHFRLIWRAAGDRTAESKVTKIPPLAIMSLAAVVETIYWIFTFGRIKPKALRRDLLEFTFLERTFSIEKARKRLGYVPKANRDAQVQAGVRWYLDQHLSERDKVD